MVIKLLKEKRRYVHRRYKPSIIYKLFKIPKTEMVLDIKWDRNNNEIVIETLLQYDKKQGDL